MLSVIRIGQHQDPLYYRKGTSDEIVIDSILSGREYPIPTTVSPKVIFDIGANIGAAAIFFAHLFPDAKIYSFEPVKENFEILKKNTDRYQNVKSFNFGLGSETSFREIFESSDPTNHGGFSLHSLGVNMSKSQMVQIKSCEEFFSENLIEPIDLIKIDTEGAEHSILTSFPTDRLKNIQYIIGELHGTKDFELMAFLSQFFDVGISKPVDSRISKFAAMPKNS